MLFSVKHRSLALKELVPRAIQGKQRNKTGASDCFRVSGGLGIGGPIPVPGP